MRIAAPTESQAADARRMAFRFCVSRGMPHHDADDAAQATVLKVLTRDWKNTPNDVLHGVARILHQARRYGVWTLLPGNTTRRDRAAAEPAPVRDTAPPYADPAVVAAMADRPAGSDRKRAAARAGLTPAAYTLHAMGWGPMDEDDAARTVPSVPQCGPGYTPPTVGDHGSVGSTDPNPASRDAARLRCLNDWRRVAGLPPIQ